MTDPAQPVEQSRWFEAGTDCVDVAQIGNVVYLACGAAGIKCVSVANPEAPTLIGTIAAADAKSVAALGSILYVGDGPDVHLWDVTDPWVPEDLGSLGLAGQAPIVRIYVDGGRLYCLYSDGLLIISDLANPQGPIELGRVIGQPNVTDIAVRGRYAYCAYNGAGLLVIDVSDPQNTEVLWTDGGSQTIGVAIGRDGADYDSARLQI